ncbi:MAG: MFS transporter [Clostridiales bacterium]|nr:MFS transporter [Clostridiales bacterium]
MGKLVWAFSSIILTSIVGLSSQQAGWAMMFYSFSMALGIVAGGKAADYYGRKRALLVFTIFSCIFKLISSFFCTTVWIIPLTIGSFFFGNGIFPVFSAMVADVVKSTGSTKKTESFSLLYMCSNLGFALGPMISGGLVENHLPYLYIIEVVVSLIGACLFCIFTTEIYSVKKLRPSVSHDESDDVVHTLRVGTLTMLMRRKILAVFIGLYGCSAACYSAVDYLLPMQFRDNFGLGRGSVYAGRVWTVNAIVVIFMTSLIVRYTKKNHQFKCSAIACALYAVGFGSYAYLTKLPLYFVAVVLWTLGEVFISTGAGAFIAENSPPSHVARFQSLYEAVRSLGAGIGPIIYGQMLLLLPYSEIWKSTSVTCFIIAAIFLTIYLKVSRSAYKS